MPSQVEPQTGADDVRDRVYGSDFVEMNFFGDGAVDGGFGDRQLAKHCQTPSLGPVWQLRRTDRCFDIGQVAVVVAFFAGEDDFDFGGLLAVFAYRSRF